MTTQTLTLTEFLLARIAEDEAAAQHLSQFPARGRRAARMRAECVAKRRIVEFASEFSGETRYETGRRFALDETLRILAAVYADHQDYRGEWRA